jgi:L-threonylcarbamoyladenylate synthase
MEKLKVSSENLNRVIKRAVEVIKKGGVVICPTDTVYGLIANAKNEKAVKKVFKIKKRNFGKPIPIFVRDLRTAKKIAVINKNQEKFLRKFWPGKLTAVLKVKFEGFPKGILGKNKKIGLRIPDYKLLDILLKKLNFPLTGTSANISGKPASTKIKDVLKQFKNQKEKPDLILDAGNLKSSPPSTVIDLVNFKILRKGEIKI